MRKNQKSGLFAGMEQKLLRSDAYLELTWAAKTAITLLELTYWEGARNNPMEMSQQNLAVWVGCSPRTAQQILSQLDDYGFLYREHAGTIKGPTSGRTAVYRMTWRPDNSGKPASHDYLSFNSSIEKKLQTKPRNIAF